MSRKKKKFLMLLSLVLSFIMSLEVSASTFTYGSSTGSSSITATLYNSDFEEFLPLIRYTNSYGNLIQGECMGYNNNYDSSTGIRTYTLDFDPGYYYIDYDPTKKVKLAWYLDRSNCDPNYVFVINYGYRSNGIKYTINQFGYTNNDEVRYDYLRDTPYDDSTYTIIPESQTANGFVCTATDDFCGVYMYGIPTADSEYDSHGIWVEGKLMPRDSL